VKILNVDDQAENLYLIEAAARACGHEVISAHNGVEGLKELRTQPVDIIVSDILMPEMDGFRFCREVTTSERFSHIPFVFYSATYTSRTDQEFGLALGASRFVVKPADPAEFIAILEEVFKEREAGELPSHAVAAPDDEDYLKAYNQRLIAKLEQKIGQLDSASKKLAKALDEKEQQIEQRRQAESELRLANFTLEHASVAIFLATKDTHRLTRVNQAACDMTGYTEGELLKLSSGDLESGPRAHTAQNGAANSGQPELRGGTSEPHTFETSYRHRNGTTYPVEIVESLLEFEGLQYVVSFVHDISERREAERQNAQLESELRQSQKMEALGRLTGGIAHDFNNSLTVILGYAELLRESRGGAHTAEAVNAIYQAGMRSKDLVSRLMGFSRQQIVAPRALNLNQVLAGSKQLLSRLIGEHIDLQVSPADGLWEVLLDPTQADQVLMNLAANARDAMPAGGRLVVTTSNVFVNETYRKQNPLAAVGDYVLLEVADTGEGMDSETAAQAFDPFFTTKPAGKGTGMGLATVYGIVRQNHGFIILDSDRGHGTSFKIYFPRLATAAAKPDAAKSTARPIGPRTGTILLVEDDEMVRNMTAEVLTMLGYKTLVAANAEGAIRLCGETSRAIDLVITDVVMPGMMGTELRDRLLSVRPNIRVLFVSGYSSEVLAGQGNLKSSDLKSGVRFLQKPFTLTDLTLKIEELLETESAAGAA
jgi:PAS domain S-box-containing protein